MLNFRSGCPVFIVGHPRSGSTLLASLLGRHSRMYACPETHYWDGMQHVGAFFKIRMRFWTGERFVNEMYRVNPRLEDVPVDKSEWVHLLAQYESISPSLVFDLLIKLIGRKFKRRVVEKTPRHLEFVHHIFRSIPEAKIICIMRDGRDAVESLMRVPWTHSNPARHASYWAWCVRYAFRMRAKYPDRFLLVRYEELLSQPEAVLSKICEFIGETFEPSMMETVGNSSVVPEWEAKWKKRSARPLDPSGMYKWKSESPERVSYIQWFMREELKRLGHELDTRKVALPPWAERIIYNRWVFGIVYMIVRFLKRLGINRKQTYRTRQLRRRL